MKIGLVLEGGGLRGMYTIGVLDKFMDENINFDYVVGVSAGACNGVSFISNQKGRNYRINTEYITDKRYISIENFIKTKSLFGMEFLFDYVPDHLDILDKEAILKNKAEFKVGVTNVITGKSEFFDKNKVYETNDVIKASSSIPIFSPMVKIDNEFYLDGGTACPIPIKQAFLDGCDKVIVVLTRERSYIKSPEKFRTIYKKIFKDYPKMIEVLDNRHIVYNETLEYLKECENNGTALVIAPKTPPVVGRFEKNTQKLKALYDEGLNDANEILNLIKEFLEKPLDK